MLMVVDQPNTIGALPVAVARDCGCVVAYLPAWRCAKRRTCIPGNRRLMPVTRSSSSRQPGRCRTPCARSIVTAGCSRR